MTSEIRVNSLTNRSGLSTVSITDTGVVVAGILTANTGSFSGNVSVGGTLTYEDVTYVDSVGIITAQAGIDVTGGNVGIGTDNPFAKLHVNITSPTTVPAAGSNSHPVVIGDVGFGAAIGALDNGKSYIQGTRWDGTATNYSLLLNPNGGSIGIGTNNPSDELSVVSSLTTDSVLRLQGGNSAGKGSGIRLMKGASAVGYIGPESWLFGSSNTSDTLVISQNAQANLSITSAGLVGINDTSPDATLSVGGSTAFIDVGAAGGNRGKIGYSSNDLYFGTSSSSGEFIFKNNVTSTDNPASSGTERLRITSDGNVNIGGNFTQSTARLSVQNGGECNLTISGNAASGGTGGLLVLKNRNSNNNTGSAIQGEDASGQTTSSIQFINSNDSTNEGYMSFFTRPGNGSLTERVRITDSGRVHVTAGDFKVTDGNSGLLFQESNNGAFLWLDGADGDFSGGDYYGIAANNSAQLQFGYAGIAHVVLNSSGHLSMGTTNAAAKLDVRVASNNPTTGSPASGSFLQVRSDTTTVGNGPSLALMNLSGSKETGWRLSALTASGNNGDFAIHGYSGGATYTERFRILNDGQFETNGVRNIYNSFNLVNNTTYNWDFTVPAEGGYGNSFYLVAGYNHYYTTSYGAHRTVWFSARGTSVNAMGSGIEQYHSQSGSWTFSKPNTSTVRITKTGGTYGGSGYGFFHLMYNHF